MSVTVEIKEDGVLKGIVLLKERTFGTGSRGWFAVTKAEVGGKRHQCQVQLVEIGSGKQQQQQEEEKVSVPL